VISPCGIGETTTDPIPSERANRLLIAPFLAAPECGAPQGKRTMEV
jgi:hypothetical protein